MDRADIASFVPRWLTARLSPPRSSSRAPGALLFADVSGFTRLSVALSSKYGAAAGAEKLSAALDGFFAPLLAEVREAGGTPLAFAGDGLLCCFPADDGDLAGATLAAASAASRMIERLASVAPVEGVEVGLHCALTHGELVSAALGGHAGRFAPVVLGAPVARLGVVFPGTPRGQVVIAAEALASIAHAVEAQHLDAERSRLLRVITRPPKRIVPRVDEPHADRWLPDAVRGRSKLPLGRWMAEMRSLTVLFVSLATVDVTDVDGADAAVRAAQEELHAHRGALHQVTLDEKGLAVTAVFGLDDPRGDRPPLSAVRCALSLRDRLEHLGVEPRLGVATGRLFVGPIGDAGQRQLAIVGAPMIRAARCARDQRGVTIDGPSRDAVEGWIELSAAEALDVEHERVPVWRAVSSKPRARVGSADAIIGREQALRAIDRAMLRLHRDGSTSIVSFDGPAGIGKSRLAAHAAESARALGLQVVELVGDLPSADRPYQGLRAELERRLGIDERTTAADRAHIAQRCVSRVADSDGLAPLLGLALGVAMADTPRTAAFAAQRRADVAADLVAELLVTDDRRVVVVDDAQWLDTATGQVLEQILRSRGATLVVVCRRVPADELPAPIARVLERAERISLPALSTDEVAALVSARLGSAHASEAFVRWITSRAAGSPFFVREVVASLVASRFVEVEDGRVVREASLEELNRAAPPPSVDAVVTRRIDALPVSAQLALKLASVLGIRSSREMVAALHPHGLEAAAVALAALADAELVRTGAASEPLEIAHRIVLDVAYGLVPLALRAELHASAAAWLERREGAEPSELAWHWEHAGDRARAARWLEVAWARADHVGALTESHGLARRALTLLDDGDRLARARWLRRLSDASANLSEYARAIDEAAEALRALGRDLPSEKSGWQRMLARGVLSQLAHRALPSRVWARGREADEEAALALARAGEGFFFVKGDQLVSLACFLGSVSAAERVSEQMVGRVPNAFGVVGTAATAMGMPRVGAYYHQRTLRMATARGEDRDIAPALFHIASCQAMQSRWRLADETYETCARHCVEAGHRHSLLFVRSAQTMNSLIRGDLARAEAMADELAVHASALRHERGAALATIARAAVALARGDVVTAEQLAREARDSMRSRADLTWTFPASILARAALGAGRPRDAIAEARAVTSALRGTRPVDYRRLEGFAGPAEALVRMPDHAGGEVDEALGLLRVFARAHRVGWPRYHLLRGVVLARRGQHRKADAALREAVRTARERDLWIDLARAELALARLREDHAAMEIVRGRLRRDRLDETTLGILR